MTHKLINMDQAAEWLHVPVKSVEGFMSKGWLTPAVPVEPSFFDATRINQLKKRLEETHRKAKWRWSLAGAGIGFALAAWFIGRASRQDNQESVSEADS